LGGETFAIDDACTHEGFSLSGQGELFGREVECLMHGSTFDLASGAVTGPPAMRRARTYRVLDEGGRLYIDVDDLPDEV
jgi:3-phenylpropionate/trans-cinnamate dioxygenase ferredoxin subunit